MALPDKKLRVFGIGELWIEKLLTDVAGAAPTYSAPIKIDGVQSLTYEGDPQEIEGRGDERILEVEFQDDKASVGFESLYFPMAAAVIINGGTITDGADDAEMFEPAPDETGEYVRIKALTKNKKVMITLHKVRGRLSIKGMTGGQFVNASFKGTAIHTTGDVNTKPRRYSVKQGNTALTVVGG